jgi:hypothetical protein
MSCDKKPYNINRLKDFNQYTPNSKTNYSTWLYCLNKNFLSETDSNIMNTRKLMNDNNTTSEEMNNYSMSLYKNDLNYTFGKILFLIVLIVTYMYCFKVTGIMLPIMQLFEKIKLGMNSVSDTINKELPKIKDKIPEVKQDIKNATNKLTNKLYKNSSK